MTNLTRQLFIVLAIGTLAGCSGAPDYDGPPRFPLSGKVTLDGEPVDGGMIAFIQQGGGQRPTGGVITGGQYSIPEEKGANAGLYRVEIRWLKPTGKQHLDSADTGEFVDEVAQAIPAHYSAQSVLSANVSETSTTFDFDLKSN